MSSSRLLVRHLAQAVNAYLRQNLFLGDVVIHMVTTNHSLVNTVVECDTWKHHSSMALGIANFS